MKTGGSRQSRPGAPLRTCTLGIVLVGGLALLAASCSSPQPAKSADNRPVEAPKPAPAPPPAAAPKPAPKPEPAPAPEPKRRAAAPKPEPKADPEPAPAAAPDPGLVTLHVESDVPDAQVFVDRAFIGKAPVTTTDIKAGPHKINVAAPGFEGVAKDVDLVAGKNDVTLKMREVRLNASLDVVHKHRMGSCKGRLIATPQGLRYETTDKDDGFRSGLLDLDTFEIDYMDKNLKIKLKSGKQYNFTDPGGKADNLFVFHRDVEKARDRLKKGDTAAQD